MDFQSIGVYSFIAPTLILIIGAVDDLRTKKIHNKLVVFLLAFAVLYQFIVFGSQGLFVGLMGSGLAFIVFLPLVMGKMLGAGDLKLMLAFGMSTSWGYVLWTSIYSIIWAAIFGVIYAISHKQFKHLILNTISVATLKKGHEIETLKIPYTIALLMGWAHQMLNIVFFSGGGL